MPATQSETTSEWIETGHGLRIADDLSQVMVRNRYGEEFGPVLAGMLDHASLDGDAFHAACDIIAYRIVSPSEGEALKARAALALVQTGDEA